MSITGTSQAIVDGRVYDELPDGRPGVLPLGVKPWRAHFALTGDASGGNASMVCQFNPGSDNTFQPYVGLTRVAVAYSGGDPGQAGKIILQQNQWEAGRPNLEVMVAVLAATDVGTTYGDANQTPVLLGRVKAGVTGDLIFTSGNWGSSITATLFMSGVISDHAFTMRNDWRV